MREVTYRVMLSMLQEYGLSNDFDVKRTHMLHIASTGVIDVQTTRNTNTAQGRLYKIIHRLQGSQSYNFKKMYFQMLPFK